MSGIKAVRTELRESLEDIGYKSETHVPSKINPPLVLVSTGDPFLTESDLFGSDELVVHLELFLLAASGTNLKETDDLDDMIEKVAKRLTEDGWKFEGASAPYMSTANSKSYLTSKVSISSTYTTQ